MLKLRSPDKQTDARELQALVVVSTISRLKTINAKSCVSNGLFFAPP